MPVLRNEMKGECHACPPESSAGGGQRVMKLAKERDASGIKKQDHWAYTYYVRDAQGNVMATYKRTFNEISGTQVTDKLALDETHLYGSSRIGVRDRSQDGIYTDVTYNYTAMNTDKSYHTTTTASTTHMAAVNTATPERKLGYKAYELVNHLGNVLVTVSDRKLEKQLGSSSTIDYYVADVKSASDYSAFGAPMAGRSFSSANYRYGFNGKEKESELHGNSGDAYDFGARIYDARLGRFLSVDPYSDAFADKSTYLFAADSPIQMIDKNGMWAEVTITKYYSSISSDGTEVFKVKRWYNIFKKTTHIEKKIVIHNQKFYFSGTMANASDASKMAYIQAYRDNVAKTWTAENQTDPEGKGPSISVDVTYADDPIIVTDLSDVKMRGKHSDDLIYVTKPEVIEEAYHPILTNLMYGIGADEFVEGRLTVINEGQLKLADLNRPGLSNKISTAAHTMGHLGGLPDNFEGASAMDNGSPKKPSYKELKMFYGTKSGSWGGSYKRWVNKVRRVERKQEKTGSEG